MTQQCTYPAWLQDELPTPAMVFDESKLRLTIRSIRRCAGDLSADLLYSLKACSTARVVEIIAEAVDGLSCSSLFEAQLAREIMGASGSVHMTSPALTAAGLQALSSCCDYLSFNSLSQLDRLSPGLDPGVQRGLRVNPGINFGLDERYDPCRRHSKLGVPVDQLRAALSTSPERLRSLHGIHIHSNCDSRDLGQLSRVVQEIEGELHPLLESISWINLGGGYLLNDPENTQSLAETLESLRSRYGLRVLVEPGSAFVRAAGYLVSEVTDLISSDGKNVAVLDTSVNHMPEVFEYQFEPDVMGDCDGANNQYLLAGGTCLAGDLFGEYTFREELKIGSRVAFKNVGSYTTTKSNLFNGIALPSVFLARLDGKLELLNECTYGDFRSRA